MIQGNTKVRKALLILLLLAPLLASCSKTYTYQSYEVIRSFNAVNPGEDVKLLKKDGELIQGTVVQVEKNVLTVATFDRGRKKVTWEEVRVAERVRKAVVIVP